VILNAHSATAPLQRAADFCCLGTGYLVAGEIAVRLSSRRLFVFPRDGRWEAQYSTLFLLALLSWVAVTSYSRTYQSNRPNSLSFALGALTQAIILWVPMTIAGVFLLKLPNMSRQFIAYFLAASGIFILSRQTAMSAFLGRLRRFGYHWRSAVILGSPASCETFAKLLTDVYPTGYRVSVRPVSCDAMSRPDTALPLVVHADDVFIVGTNHAQLYESAGSDVIAAMLRLGKRVHIIPGLLNVKLFRQSFGDVAGIPVISLMKGQLGKLQAATKRFADIAISSILLLVLSPLLAATAVLVKLSSQGPVVFTQRRLGLNSKPFRIYKFRTMAANAEEMLTNSPLLYALYLANNFKLPRHMDPRVTRLGSFLRASSLDELPQLVNVLLGDMSLVGPRPIVPAEVDKYGDAAVLFLSVKPGITGHWQVNGRSDLRDYDQRVELDLEYIRDQSLGRDFEILLKTVPVVLRRKGAH